MYESVFLNLIIVHHGSFHRPISVVDVACITICGPVLIDAEANYVYKISFE